MKIQVGDWVSPNREWVQYSYSDDVGSAEVIHIGNGYAVLHEEDHGAKIIYDDNPDKLAPYKEKRVNISMELYRNLDRESRHLELLMAGGVDNWDGYVPAPFGDDEEDEDEE